MGDFNRCIDLILAEEGGYVHHPNDPGGETKFGIAKRAYPHLDIARLTLADVVALYHLGVVARSGRDELADADGVRRLVIL